MLAGAIVLSMCLETNFEPEQMNGAGAFLFRQFYICVESFEGVWGNFFKSFPKKRILFQKFSHKKTRPFRSCKKGILD